MLNHATVYECKRRLFNDYMAHLVQNTHYDRIQGELLFHIVAEFTCFAALSALLDGVVANRAYHPPGGSPTGEAF